MHMNEKTLYLLPVIGKKAMLGLNGCYMTIIILLLID